MMSGNEIEKFPCFLINLKRRPERLRESLDELALVDWPLQAPTIFPAVDGWKLPMPEGYRQGTDCGTLGCRLSHLRILEACFEQDRDGVVILEDDIIFPENFREGFDNFLRAVPDDWHMLFPGGQLEGRTVSVAPNVVRATRVGRTHFYVLRGEAMRAVYKHWMNSKGHVDHRLMEIQRHWNVYCPLPFLCGQRRGRSDINGRVNPQAFWNEPGPLPIILFRGPQKVLAELREKAQWHSGYDRDPRTDIDRGLLKAMRLPAETPKVLELKTWCRVLQWEVAAMTEAVTVAWHPDLTADLLRRATADPVYEVEAQTYEDALATWARLRPSVSESVDVNREPEDVLPGPQVLVPAA